MACLLFWNLANRETIVNCKLPKTEKVYSDFRSESEGKKNIHVCLFI